MIDFRVWAQVEEVRGNGMEPCWDRVDLGTRFVIGKWHGGQRVGKDLCG